MHEKGIAHGIKTKRMFLGFAVAPAAFALASFSASFLSDDAFFVPAFLSYS